MNESNQSLEQSFQQLDELIAKLEKEDISLEDSFQLYNEGVNLLKICNDAIDKVEKQLIILKEEA